MRIATVILLAMLALLAVDVYNRHQELALLRADNAAMRMDNERLQRIEAGLHDEIHRLRTGQID